MNRVVLEASAVLAILNQEPCEHFTVELLNMRQANAVDPAEVQSKLVRRGPLSWRGLSR